MVTFMIILIILWLTSLTLYCLFKVMDLETDLMATKDNLKKVIDQLVENRTRINSILEIKNKKTEDKKVKKVVKEKVENKK